MSDWLFLCGILSGITTWLFGFGGGFVTVPLLYLLATGGWGRKAPSGSRRCRSPSPPRRWLCSVQRCWRPGGTRVPAP